MPPYLSEHGNKLPRPGVAVPASESSDWQRVPQATTWRQNIFVSGFKMQLAKGSLVDAATARDFICKVYLHVTVRTGAHFARHARHQKFFTRDWHGNLTQDIIAIDTPTARQSNVAANLQTPASAGCSAAKTKRGENILCSIH
jgi:hypothetical protein